MRRLLRNRLFKDSLILFGVQITGYILPFVSQPYLARVLGPENIGLVGLGSALSAYFNSLVEYGFAITGPRQVAVAQHDLPQVSRIYSTIMACRTLLLLISGIIWIALLLWVPKYRAYWPLYAVSFLQVIGWCYSPNWFLQGMQRMRLVALSDYGAKFLSVALIFLLVRQRPDYVMAATLQSGAFTMAAVIGLVTTFSLLPVRLVWPKLVDVREAMRAGWPVFMSIASVTVMASTNIIILGAVTTNAQVGFLSSAMRLIIASRALVNPISSAVYPHLSKMAVQAPEDGQKFLRKQLVWLGFPFLGISLGMLFFAPLIVRILFGTEFGESGMLLRLMSPIPFVYAISTCFGNYMLAFGWDKVWSKIVLRGAVVNFAVLALLMRFMTPARSVALTMTLVDIFSAGASIFYCQRLMKREGTALRA